MEMLTEWLPRAAAILTITMGLVGFFRPQIITGAQQIALNSNMALSEARVVFGGLHLGGGTMALVLHEPLVYMTLGAGWSVGLLARFYSMVVDKTTFQDSLGGVIIDALMALLYLSVLVF